MTIEKEKPTESVPYNGNTLHIEGVNCKLSVISITPNEDGSKTAKLMAYDVKIPKKAKKSLANEELQ